MYIQARQITSCPAHSQTPGKRAQSKRSLHIKLNTDPAEEQLNNHTAICSVARDAVGRLRALQAPPRLALPPPDSAGGPL